MEELARIVTELESGQQPLSEALENFERAMQLVKECSTQLEDAAGKIELLRQMTGETVVTEPFDGTATVERKKNATEDSDVGSLF